MIVDAKGYRLNVGIVLSNDEQQLFWGRRIGHNAWQFPQGGVDANEAVEEAMYRELAEEVGLQANDVKVLGYTKHWLRYRLPKQFIRRRTKPLVVGQKQKWFLLKLISGEEKICLDTSAEPEFDHWRWVDYWYPPKKVIFFKQKIYSRALKELEMFMK